MELTEFLLARIIEDEAHARWRMEGRMAPIPDEMEQPGTPARVLAECEAKRRIVELSLASDNDWAAEQATRYLALPYADHPDYREEWRA